MNRQDKSRSFKGIRQNRVDGASGKTGNALGPKHYMPVMHNQTIATRRSVSVNAGMGGEASDLTFVGGFAPIEIEFQQSLAGQIYDFAPLFDGYAASDAFAMAATPAGMTLNTDTGVLSGTPTTLGTGTTTITVDSAKANDGPVAVAVAWNIFADPTP